MTILFLLNKVFAAGIIASQICIVLAVIYLVFFRKKFESVKYFLGKYGMLFAFIVALTATLGSLFYSMIAGFAPCELCWFQRIFMYPLVILIFIAWLKKETGRITDYVLSLSIIGFLISLYQNYLYYGNSGLDAFCQLSSMQVSCIKRYVFEFGYVTIPLMALTTFALIILCMIFYKWHRKSN